MRVRLWLFVALLGLLASLITACSPAPGTTSTPTTSEQTEEPVLPGTLTRNCQPAQSSADSNFGNTGLSIGDKAIDFTLQDTHGSESRLSQLLAEKPVLMLFGSFT